VLLADTACPTTLPYPSAGLATPEGKPHKSKFSEKQVISLIENPTSPSGPKLAVQESSFHGSLFSSSVRMESSLGKILGKGIFQFWSWRKNTIHSNTK